MHTNIYELSGNITQESWQVLIDDILFQENYF